MRKRCFLCSAWLAWGALVVVLADAVTAIGANWQYRTSFDRDPDRAGRPQAPGEVLVWLPPESRLVRAVFLCGQLGLEDELVIDPELRRVCRENDVAIVFFRPHLSGVFHFWEPGNRDGPRLLKALDDLGGRSGHDELRRVPWITAGHSTAGIFARNVAYWKPERTAAVIHLKSGNFHQREHLPPAGSLSGVPLLAINGQFETFGPEGGIRPALGRETQWMCARDDLQRFRAANPEHLLALVVDPGADHFHGSPEIAAFVALFVRKTLEYRVPPQPPSGKALLECLAIRAKDGWLADPDLYQPRHSAAAHDQFSGDRRQAMWYYDQEIAEAAAQFDRRLDHHQVLSSPECRWLDEGDGWEFRASAAFLDAIPEQYGGRWGGEPAGHSPLPIVYRAKLNEPVERVGRDRFRLRRPARRVHVAAFHPGDAVFRSTIRWGSLAMPRLKDAARQTIEFRRIDDLHADAPPVRLAARASSGLPVHYEVDYGPVVIEDGQLKISEVPAGPRYPIPCQVTAHQLGRRLEPAVEAAPPISVTFQIIGP